jgi:hypothetical protein
MSPGSQALRGLTMFAALAFGIGLLRVGTAVPLGTRHSADAQLRLSWSARPERIEVCRTRSEAELRGRPEHMRQRVVCEGKFATYRLRIELDQRVVGDFVVKGGGFRNDRPLYVLRELRAPPGSHRLRVTFSRREALPQDTTRAAGAALPDTGARVPGDTGLFAGRSRREAAERLRRLRAAIPAYLALDTTVVLGPGQVGLVRLDAADRSLVLQTKLLVPQ